MHAEGEAPWIPSTIRNTNVGHFLMTHRKYAGVMSRHDFTSKMYSTDDIESKQLVATFRQFCMYVFLNREMYKANYHFEHRKCCIKGF